MAEKTNDQSDPNQKNQQAPKPNSPKHRPEKSRPSTPLPGEDPYDSEESPRKRSGRYYRDDEPGF